MTDMISGTHLTAGWQSDFAQRSEDTCARCMYQNMRAVSLVPERKGETNGEEIIYFRIRNRRPS